MNKHTAILDSNILVAIIDKRDNWHVKAKELVSILEQHAIDIVYVDCVMNETISVLGRRSEEQKRSGQFGDLLNQVLQYVPIDSITWILPNVQRLYVRIIEQVRQSSGALNFHDALLALFAQESGIRGIVSFDRDFDSIAWLDRLGEPEDIVAYSRV